MRNRSWRFFNTRNSKKGNEVCDPEIQKLSQRIAAESADRRAAIAQVQDLATPETVSANIERLGGDLARFEARVGDLRQIARFAA